MKMLSFHKLMVIWVVVWALVTLDALPSLARPTDVIIVTGADVTRIVSSAPSSILNNDLALVAPHVVVQFGDGLRQMTLATLPSSLQSLLNNVSTHISIQFADTNRAFPLAYPTAFIKDTAPPVVSQIKASPAAGGSAAEISWITDEFANSAVEYGLQPGNYTQVVTDSLYVKNHTVRLSNLIVGNTYYYRVRSLDLSGNQTDSLEQSFVAKSNTVYLPLLRK